MKQTENEKRRKYLAIAALMVFLLLAALVAWKVGIPMVKLASEPEAFRRWVEQYGLSGQLLYMGMVLIQVFFAVIPGEPLEIAGGYAFGAVEGSLLCLLACTLGSLLVFLLVRRFGTRFVELFYSKEKLDSVGFLKSSPKRTFLFFLVFMLPGTPKDLLCYFAGLTDIRLPAFLLIASLGRLPAIVTSAVGGSALGSRSYSFAAIVFVATFLLSASGLLLYNRISRKNTQDDES